MPPRAPRRVRRTLLLAVLAAVALAVASSPADGHVRGAGPSATIAALVLPVDGEVLHGFSADGRFGPGHRGIDLATTPGSPVRAPGTGLVTFAGTVVDARWVTVDLGWVRATVGPLETVGVTRGERVTAGQTVGTSGRAHDLAALHLSTRIGQRYVDPLRLTRPRVSLVPVSRGAVTSVPVVVKAHRGRDGPSRQVR